MGTILQKLSDLNAAIAAAQTRVGSGVIVQQADLDNVSTGLDAAIKAVDGIAAAPATPTTPA